MTEQDRIQVWNDAVEACRNAAWMEVEAMEREAATGMASPCRTVVRAVSNVLKQGDDRMVIHGIDPSMFPTPSNSR